MTATQTRSTTFVTAVVGAGPHRRNTQRGSTQRSGLRRDDEALRVHPGSVTGRAIWSEARAAQTDWAHTQLRPALIWVRDGTQVQLRDPLEV